MVIVTMVIGTMVLNTRVVMYRYKYPRPSVAVDLVTFGYDATQAEISVLLIKRKHDPFEGKWALPGGFVEVGTEDDFSGSKPSNYGESLEDAARRELKEETGAEPEYIEQLGTFGDPNRDPRGRVISVAYLSLVRSKDLTVKASSDAAEAVWWPLKSALRQKFAFDHNTILNQAVTRLHSKVRYAPIGFNLLPQKFTLHELQELYEALLLRQLDKSNFRRKVLSVGILAEAGQRVHGKQTVQLYRFDKRAYDKVSAAGFNFEPKFVKGK